MTEPTRSLKVMPPVPPQLEPVVPFRALKDIPQRLIQKCDADKQELRNMERWIVMASATSGVAAVASRFAYHKATGEWGEGLAHATPKFPGKVWDVITGNIPPAPHDHLTDTFWGKMTVGLTGLAGFAFGATLAIDAGYASLESAYKTKCTEVEMARIAEATSRVSVARLLGNLPPASAPEHDPGPDEAARSIHHDGIRTFVNAHPVVTGVLAVGLAGVVVGALLLTGGAAAPAFAAAL